MDKDNLTKEEQEFLDSFVSQMEVGEMSQVQELSALCTSPYQWAKTHSVYVKDWEKTKNKLEDNLKRGILPPGTSENLSRAVLHACDKVMHKKLELVRFLFETKFNESIYNYLGPDGKTKFLGLF